MRQNTKKTSIIRSTLNRIFNINDNMITHNPFYLLYAVPDRSIFSKNSSGTSQA